MRLAYLARRQPRGNRIAVYYWKRARPARYHWQLIISQQLSVAFGPSITEVSVWGRHSTCRAAAPAKLLLASIIGSIIPAVRLKYKSVPNTLFILLLVIPVPVAVAVVDEDPVWYGGYPGRMTVKCNALTQFT